MGTDTQPHPEHPLGPLRTKAWSNDTRVVRSWDSGWQGGIAVQKRSGDLVLGREWPKGHYYPSNAMTPYKLYAQEKQHLATFEAHWADWDQQGRLVATIGGRIVAGKLTRDKRLVWRQLAELHNEKPSRLEAPAWAQSWKPLPRRRRRHESIPNTSHRL